MCAYSGLPQIEKRRRVGLSPSTIDNGLTWWFFLETLPHLFPSQLVRREYRYPYLDRNLVEFLFRVPRSKLVHPGRRRALMRNALRGIVPDEILERRRKAYIVRQPLIALQADRAKIEALLAKPLVVEYGLVIPSRLQTAVRSVCTGHEPQLWPSLLRCISFELWLQALAASPFQPAEFV
jgi:asparagine synthase (glutamine-hydrolysing)